MRKGLTEIVFILDSSGSMAGLISDTIGGFNAMIEEQKKQQGEVIVSTVIFNTASTVLHDRVKLCDVQPLTDKEYRVCGCTALYDAVGSAVHHIGNVHKYARNEDVPEKTLFVITTDGMENASRRYTHWQIKDMILRQQEKYGWEFIFLGANIDAAEAAGSMGIRADNAVNYNADSRGTEVLYASVSEAVTCARNTDRGGSMSKRWRRRLDADNKR